MQDSSMSDALTVRSSPNDENITLVFLYECFKGVIIL